MRKTKTIQDSAVEVTTNGKLTRQLEIPDSIGIKAGRLASLKDAKRLSSRLIRAFIRGEIHGTDAKTLSYLLSNFIQAAQASDLEQRLEDLETKINNEP